MMGNEERDVGSKGNMAMKVGHFVNTKTFPPEVSIDNHRTVANLFWEKVVNRSAQIAIREKNLGV